MRRWLLVLIGLLYVFSVPWYRDASAPLSIVLGLPDWVTVAIGCYVAVAFLNAFAWIQTDVPDALVPDAVAPDALTSDVVPPDGAPSDEGAGAPPEREGA